MKFRYFYYHHTIQHSHNSFIIIYGKVTFDRKTVILKSQFGKFYKVFI